MSKTEIEEFEEALAMLRAAGVNAMVCDTPVGVSLSSAKCGHQQRPCEGHSLLRLFADCHEYG